MKSLTALATRAVPAGHVRGRRASLPLMLLRDVGLPLLLTRLLLVLVTLTAPQWRWTVPDPGRFLSPAPPVGGALLSRWYHWDAAWYLRIAGNGPQMGYSHYTENVAHNFGAFAFIFDRGCYHAVRRTDVAPYMRVVARISKGKVMGP